MKVKIPHTKEDVPVLQTTSHNPLRDNEPSQFLYQVPLSTPVPLGPVLWSDLLTSVHTTVSGPLVHSGSMQVPLLFLEGDSS